MHRRIVLIVGVLGVATCRPLAGQQVHPPSGLAADLAYLASPELEGRAVGSAGGEAAALFVAQRYVELGVPAAFPFVCEPLSPCGAQYFQLFEVDGLGAKNVLAVIPGADPALRARYIVLGAHYDHLGRSVVGARDPERQVRIRPGADDNASGTAALLELGRRLALNPAPSSVLLVHFDAEERGLVGSQIFVEDPSVPLDSVVLMINLDMIGRLRDQPLRVEVTSAAERLQPVVDSLAVPLGISLRYSQLTAGRSDHSSFSERGVPAIAFFTGFHGDYHRTTDTPDKLDVSGIGRIVDLVEAVVRAVY